MCISKAPGSGYSVQFMAFGYVDPKTMAQFDMGAENVVAAIACFPEGQIAVHIQISNQFSKRKKNNKRSMHRKIDLIYAA